MLSNQIINGPNSNDTLSDTNGEEGLVMPALGSTWSHFINTRIILQFIDNSKREVIFI